MRSREQILVVHLYTNTHALTPQILAHLGAQISRAKYVLDLAGQEDLLELRRKVRSSVGDVKVPDAEHEDQN